MSVVHSQSPSGALTVISANVEGLAASKASILSERCKEQHCLQETHRTKDQARPRMPGVVLVAERPHNKDVWYGACSWTSNNKHGSSVFVRDGLKMNSLSVCEEENVEFITVQLPGVVCEEENVEFITVALPGVVVHCTCPCTNHHLNYSASLLWDKETSLTS